LVHFQHSGVLNQSERVISIRTTLSILGQYLTKIGVEYWLTHGTLLGSWRHQDIIPWDDDADIEVTQDGLSKLHREVLHNPPPENYTFIFRVGQHSASIPFKFADIKTGIYVDGLLTTRFEKKLIRLWPYSCPSCRDSIITLPYSDIFPLRKCPLGDTQHWCPNKTHEYLLKLYRTLGVPRKWQRLVPKPRDKS